MILPLYHQEECQNHVGASKTETCQATPWRLYVEGGAEHLCSDEAPRNLDLQAGGQAQHETLALLPISTVPALGQVGLHHPLPGLALPPWWLPLPI